jgi:hypothetical protein
MRRPTKKFWDACTESVETSGSAYSPDQVCGALWFHKMTPSQRKAWMSKKRLGDLQSCNRLSAFTGQKSVIITDNFGTKWIILLNVVNDLVLYPSVINVTSGKLVKRPGTGSEYDFVKSETHTTLTGKESIVIRDTSGQGWLVPISYSLSMGFKVYLYPNTITVKGGKLVKQSLPDVNGRFYKFVPDANIETNGDMTNKNGSGTGTTETGAGSDIMKWLIPIGLALLFL